MDSIFFYQNPEQSAGSGKGALQKLKVTVQPNIFVKGWPTEAGSAALAGFKALEDAAVVERLSGAGAVLIGSTAMSEFGFGLKGSQAGCALGKKSADVELMLDMAGEARLAAAREGVCGFKPSYGLISRIGLVGLIPSMESCGILARDIKSVRDVLETIAGPDERDFSLPDEKMPDFSAQDIEPAKTTLGIIPEVVNGLPSDQREAFAKICDALKKDGFQIKELSFPDFSHFLLVHQIIGSVEASSCAGRYDSVRYGQRVPGAKNWNEMYLQSRGAAFGTLLKSYLFQGAFFQFEKYDAYDDACRLRARLVKEMQTVAGQADALILPTVNPAADLQKDSLADLYAQFAYTAFANVTGRPALHIPGANGAGVQLSAKRLDDGRLLSLGQYLLSHRQGGKS
ncbi:MAG TPA: amidase family protein [Smithellaceae bacterium]|nr:amidase family protein [Smithellaceae bacterium]